MRAGRESAMTTPDREREALVKLNADQQRSLAQMADELDRLTVTNEVLRIALERALEREQARGRMPG